MIDQARDLTQQIAANLAVDPDLPFGERRVLAELVESASIWVLADHRIRFYVDAEGWDTLGGPGEDQTRHREWLKVAVSRTLGENIGVEIAQEHAAPSPIEGARGPCELDPFLRERVCAGMGTPADAYALLALLDAITRR